MLWFSGDEVRKLLKLVETLQLERARRCDDDDGRAFHYPRHAHRHAAAVRGQHRWEEKRGTSKHGGNRKSNGDTADDNGNNKNGDNNHGGDEHEDRTDGDEDEGKEYACPSSPGSRNNNMSTHRHGATTATHTTVSGSGGGGHGHDHCYSAPISREDLRRLRLENRNMHLLLVENRELKKQAREDSARAEGARRELLAELGRVKGELAKVSRELKVTEDRLLFLQGGCVTSSRWARKKRFNSAKRACTQFAQFSRDQRPSFCCLLSPSSGLGPSRFAFSGRHASQTLELPWTH